MNPLWFASKDIEMKESWLMEHLGQLPPAVRGGYECKSMKPLRYQQHRTDQTEPAGQLLGTCKQAGLGVKEFTSHFLSSVSA